jgi:error-prone DNA polymerase
MDLSEHLAALGESTRWFQSLANADEVRRPVPESRIRPRTGAAAASLFAEIPELKEDLKAIADRARQAMPGGRNFH